MNKKNILIIIIGLIILTYAFDASAGMGYKVKCENCGYSDNVNFGRGMRFGQITGYCMNCDRFVYLTWECSKDLFDNEMLNTPDPIAFTWDLTTSSPLKIYTCPNCSRPFAEINSPESMKYCPKCKQLSLIVEKSGLLYD